jgi:hypothetical protein
VKTTAQTRSDESKIGESQDLRDLQREDLRRPNEQHEADASWLGVLVKLSESTRFRVAPESTLLNRPLRRVPRLLTGQAVVFFKCIAVSLVFIFLNYKQLPSPARQAKIGFIEPGPRYIKNIAAWQSAGPL